MVTDGAEKHKFRAGSNKEVQVVLVIKTEGLIAGDPDDRPVSGNSGSVSGTGNGLVLRAISRMAPVLQSSLTASPAAVSLSTSDAMTSPRCLLFTSSPGLRFIHPSMFLSADRSISVRWRSLPNRLKMTPSIRSPPG